VGSMLRRLNARDAREALISKIAACFLPVMVDFGISHATEAVAHAARAYIAGLQTGEGLVKLDFQNAFNMFRHFIILQTVSEEIPEFDFVNLQHRQPPSACICCCRPKVFSKATHLDHCCNCIVAKTCSQNNIGIQRHVPRRRFSRRSRQQFVM